MNYNFIVLMIRDTLQQKYEQQGFHYKEDIHIKPFEKCKLSYKL